jgi:hypothetical protein
MIAKANIEEINTFFILFPSDLFEGYLSLKGTNIAFGKVQTGAGCTLVSEGAQSAPACDDILNERAYAKGEKAAHSIP